MCIRDSQYSIPIPSLQKIDKFFLQNPRNTYADGAYVETKNEANLAYNLQKRFKLKQEPTTVGRVIVKYAEEGNKTENKTEKDEEMLLSQLWENYLQGKKENLQSMESLIEVGNHTSNSVDGRLATLENILKANDTPSYFEQLRKVLKVLRVLYTPYAVGDKNDQQELQADILISISANRTTKALENTTIVPLFVRLSKLFGREHHPEILALDLLSKPEAEKTALTTKSAEIKDILQSFGINEDQLMYIRSIFSAVQTLREIVFDEAKAKTEILVNATTKIEHLLGLETDSLSTNAASRAEITSFTLNLYLLTSEFLLQMLSFLLCSQFPHEISTKTHQVIHLLLMKRFEGESLGNLDDLLTNLLNEQLAQKLLAVSGQEGTKPSEAMSLCVADSFGVFAKLEEANRMRGDIKDPLDLHTFFLQASRAINVDDNSPLVKVELNSDKFPLRHRNGVSIDYRRRVPLEENNLELKEALSQTLYWIFERLMTSSPQEKSLSFTEFLVHQCGEDNIAHRYLAEYILKYAAGLLKNTENLANTFKGSSAVLTYSELPPDKEIKYSQIDSYKFAARKLRNPLAFESPVVELTIEVQGKPIQTNDKTGKKSLKKKALETVRFYELTALASETFQRTKLRLSQDILNANEKLVSQFGVVNPESLPGIFEQLSKLHHSSKHLSLVDQEKGQLMSIQVVPPFFARPYNNLLSDFASDEKVLELSLIHI
eukprot:TRINITY_DN9809_c0_g1_i2.p1 TRINITY_DN9809_c0_g1~~TRINITY_DN9809_c0_g1_i2.p1  ORF type:complete len:718 (+),score=163.22 TRINITY_DN9809_c0_g1_i2:63-2216(+)